MSWRDAAGELHRAAPMAPQVQITGATTVELDLRKAKPVRVNAPEPTETYRAAFKYQRTSVDSNWGLGGGVGTEYGPGEPNWWVLPTSEVSLGTLTFNSRHVLVPPSVTMKVTGNGDSFDLDARYATPDNSIHGGGQGWKEDGKNRVRSVRLTIPRLPTNGQKPVVYAGTGSAEELAKVDAKGALVLLRPTDICTTTCNFTALRERVAAAAAAGAVGVLVVSGTDRVTLESYGTRNYKCENSDPDSCPPVEPYAALPIVTVSPAEAATLIRRIGGGASSGVQVELGGNSEVSKSYALAFSTSGRIPASLPYKVLPEELDRVDHRIHADRPGVTTYFGWSRTTDSRPGCSGDGHAQAKPANGSSPRGSRGTTTRSTHLSWPPGITSRRPR